jgi:hypothetical protein
MKLHRSPGLLIAPQIPLIKSKLFAIGRLPVFCVAI